ncbi:MAG: hypothetical protein J0M01_18405 [Dechloromonas sp.]|jgi:hypothetical protein|nr:hypothetical protein [Dechloromonas sp.]
MSRIIPGLIQWFLILGLMLLGIGLKFNSFWPIIIGVLLLNLLPMLCFISLFFRE